MERANERLPRFRALPLGEVAQQGRRLLPCLAAEPDQPLLRSGLVSDSSISNVVHAQNSSQGTVRPAATSAFPLAKESGSHCGAGC